MRRVAAGSARFVWELEALEWADAYPQRCFQVLLAEYHFLVAQIDHLTEALQRLAKDEAYRPRVALLTSMPGLGWLAALELLLDLQDVARFRRADQLAAYEG